MAKYLLEYALPNDEVSCTEVGATAITAHHLTICIIQTENDRLGTFPLAPCRNSISLTAMYRPATCPHGPDSRRKAVTLP